MRTAQPETNIVFFEASDTGLSNEIFVAELRTRGVRVGLVREFIRALTHLDRSRADIETTIASARAIVENPKLVRDHTTKPGQGY